MAAGSTPQTPPPLPPPQPAITMELLAASAMLALLDDDLPEARRISQRPLPAFFLEEKWLWQIRVDQISRSPQDATWLVRVVALEPLGVVIGHAGFHGPPDADGAVEIAYTVEPHPSTAETAMPMRFWRRWWRRRGHTRACASCAPPSARTTSPRSRSSAAAVSSTWVSNGTTSTGSSSSSRRPSMHQQRAEAAPGRGVGALGAAVLLERWCRGSQPWRPWTGRRTA